MLEIFGGEELAATVSVLCLYKEEEKTSSVK